MYRKIMLMFLILLLSYNFTMAVYGDSSNIFIKLDRASYSGLHSVVTVTVNNKYLDVKPGNRDIARVRITSEADPRGFVLLLRETGVSTGVFTGSFSFDRNMTNSDKKLLKVNTTDSILAAHTDDHDEDSEKHIVHTATASFNMVEANIRTSAQNGCGTGYILDIYIDDADKSYPGVKDRIMAKAYSTCDPKGKTLWLVESEEDSGIFECRLYLTDNADIAGSLLVNAEDKITIKYIDSTVPGYEDKEILETVKWTYNGTFLEFDSPSYTGYNNSAKITLDCRAMNKFNDKIDYAEIKVYTTSKSEVTLKLIETSTGSGKFTGTVYFGRSESKSKGILRLSAGDAIHAYFKNENDGAVAECSAEWAPQDGRLALDRTEYAGSDIPVGITLTDMDIDNNHYEIDYVKIIARAEESTRYNTVLLRETDKNSGIFSGTVYINGSKEHKPSINLKPGQRLQIEYIDEDTTVGTAVKRIIYAEWNR